MVYVYGLEGVCGPCCAADATTTFTLASFSQQFKITPWQSSKYVQLDDKSAYLGKHLWRNTSKQVRSCSPNMIHLRVPKGRQKTWVCTQRRWQNLASTNMFRCDFWTIIRSVPKNNAYPKQNVSWNCFHLRFCSLKFTDVTYTAVTAENVTASVDSNQAVRIRKH